MSHRSARTYSTGAEIPTLGDDDSVSDAGPRRIHHAFFTCSRVHPPGRAGSRGGRVCREFPRVYSSVATLSLHHGTRVLLEKSKARAIQRGYGRLGLRPSVIGCTGNGWNEPTSVVDRGTNLYERTQIGGKTRHPVSGRTKRCWLAILRPRYPIDHCSE